MPDLQNYHKPFELNEQDVLAQVSERRRRLGRGPIRAEMALAGAGVVFLGLVLVWNLFRFF